MKQLLKKCLLVLGGLTMIGGVTASGAYWWTGRQGPEFEASKFAGVTITEVQCPSGISGGPRCGKIKAPLDYSNVAAGTIGVGFVFYPALLPEGDGKTLLQFIDGGPGQIMSEDIRPSPMRLMRWQFRNRPLLFVDPRGVGGLSQALRCPAISGYELDANESDVVAACAVSIGSQRTHYSSANTVRDFDLVRRVLGFKQVDLIAFSYGTALAPMYDSIKPGVVRSMTLDGAFQFSNYENPYFTTFFDGAMRQLNQVCERAIGCKIDETRQNLVTVVTALRDAPRSINPTGVGWKIEAGRRLDAGTIVSLLTKNASIERDDDGKVKVFYPLIGALRNAASGDWVLLELLAALDLQKNALAASSEDQKTFPLASIITCQEGSNTTWSRALPIEQRSAAFEVAIARYPDAIRFRPFTAREWSLNAFQSEYAECLKYPKAPVGVSIERRENFAATSPRETPVLILNGDLDLQTPHEDAKNAAAQFTKPFYARFKHFNHVIMPNSVCALNMVADFIRQKAVADPNVCMDTDATPYVIDRLPSKARNPDATDIGLNFLR
jgi:pimeloyl-ACP methyl ester carboxylesterase